MAIDAQKIIERYRAAYKAANGHEPPTITYDKGWFRLGGAVTSRHRRAEIEDWIRRLDARTKGIAA